MKSVLNADVVGKKVIIWTLLNVPVKDNRVVDDTRLKAASETLNFLRKKGATILMIGHLGRPKGKDPSLSFKPVAKRLGQILGQQIELLDEIKKPSSALAMLENIRFWPGEEAKDKDFASQIAGLGDIYVNDCFATSHRAFSTMLFLPKFLPSYSGITLEKEIKELSKVINEPYRPLVAIIGGAKLGVKLPVIDNLSKIADRVLVCGKLMFEIEDRDISENVVVASDDIDKKDLGPQSIKNFIEIISQAKMVVWNGPPGIFEEEKYELGTKKIAQALVRPNIYSVVGGGDTIEALNKYGLLDKINYVSTGGGAMLVLLSGKKLPGIEALG